MSDDEQRDTQGQPATDATVAEPEVAPVSEAESANQAVVGLGDEPETTAAAGPHPALAIVDEIQHHINVQCKPAWIRAKLEQIRALL